MRVTEVSSSNHTNCVPLSLNQFLACVNCDYQHAPHVNVLEECGVVMDSVPAGYMITNCLPSFLHDEGYIMSRLGAACLPPPSATL